MTKDHVSYYVKNIVKSYIENNKISSDLSFLGENKLIQRLLIIFLQVKQEIALVL